MNKKPKVEQKLKPSDVQVSVLFESKEQSVPSLKKLSRYILLLALDELNYPINTYSASFFACGLETIRRLNLDFLNKKHSTNVLSWPQKNYRKEEVTNLPSIPSVYFGARKSVFLGDIAISLDYCKEESSKLGVNFREHFKLVITHSILHLLGFEHENDTDAKIMEGMEKLLLSRTSSIWI
tara:strand:+ start:278 stop:820 length:543 start_codon:yes stop_codon:yes gene_type:complete